MLFVIATRQGDRKVLPASYINVTSTGELAGYKDDDGPKMKMLWVLAKDVWLSAWPVED